MLHIYISIKIWGVTGKPVSTRAPSSCGSDMSGQALGSDIRQKTEHGMDHIKHYHRTIRRANQSTFQHVSSPAHSALKGSCSNGEETSQVGSEGPHLCLPKSREHSLLPLWARDCQLQGSFRTSGLQGDSWRQGLSIVIASPKHSLSAASAFPSASYATGEAETGNVFTWRC